MAIIDQKEVIKSIYFRAVIKGTALDHLIKDSFVLRICKIIFKVITLQKYYPIHIGARYIVKFSKKDIFMLDRKKYKMYFFEIGKY